MASPHQQQIRECVTDIPPKPDVELVGWVLMAEWKELDGQKFLTRLVGDATSAWQVKGYLHEGLNTEWPNEPAHHNPGHPSEWVQVPSES